jgi:hypothetical protein
LSAAPAGAATAVYPNGGSGFDVSAEEWSSGGASCEPIALLCTPEAAYDATVGDPPGSISARTTVTLNLVDLFRGVEVWNSPQFTVPVGTIVGAQLRLERAFSPGGLVATAPTGTYTVTLRDLTAATEVTALSEEVGEADSAFTGRSAPVAVLGGHTYRLSIEATTAQSTLALSLIGGTTDLRFDNVGLAVETAGGGSGSLSRPRLLTLLRGSAARLATLRGKWLLVKLRCPAGAGAPCSIAAQGLLGKHRPATSARRRRLADGQARWVALRVRPRARRAVARRRRLLFREKVRAGGARATVYRRLKLVRR